MGKGSQLNTLLVEILVAVLFFALSATVILDAFVIARSQSRGAAAINDALAQAQDVADTLYLDGADAEASLLSAGFAREGDAFVREGTDFTLTVTLAEEAAGAGALHSATVSADSNGKALFELPCSRYLPEEGEL